MFLANKLVSSWKPNQFLKRIVKVSSFVFLRRVYFWIVSHNVNKTWWNSETFIRKSNLGRGQQAKYREIGANLWTLSNGFSISNIRFNQMCVSPFGGKIGFFFLPSKLPCLILNDGSGWFRAGPDTNPTLREFRSTAECSFHLEKR